MPIKSFLTRTSPSRGTGTGKSVLYCKTSGPPKFFICTPFMILGMEAEVMAACNRSWEIRVEDGQVEVKSGNTRRRRGSLGNICQLQSTGTHSQTIEREE